MLHVFIDTNVLLTFFNLAEDDLEELRKLRAAVNNGELRVWMTSQVIVELRRNREAKVADSMDALKKLKPSGGIPQIARNLPEFAAFLDARRELERQLSSLRDELLSQFDEGTLAADSVLAELLDATEILVIDSETISAAQRRVDVGNPPGKKGSLGDAINWESLLRHCPDGEDLHLVTADSDFVSRMDSDRLSAFLVAEWQETKSAKVHLYKRISSLFHEHFPNIELAAELEKEFRIRRLVQSGSFEQTHRAIAALSDYSEFTAQQARDLLDGARWNTQIRWISDDADVHEFFQRLLELHRGAFERDEWARFNGIFNRDEDGRD